MEQKATFDDLANSYDSWFNTSVGKKVFELELATLIDFIKPSSGTRVLEVGIGTGLFAMEFRKRGADVEGIDPSREMLAIAAKRGFKVQYGVGEAIPYPDNVFDVVLAMTSMEFSKTPDLFVREMVRVAKPSGTVVVGVLNLWSFYGISRRIRGLLSGSFFNDAHFYNYKELKVLLSKYVGDVKVSSSVFFNPSATSFIISRADSIERFGRTHLAPFGALLVGAGKKA
ncbi:MAG: class I SAM-dependent methyltransferase [Caldisericaceae bacterium]